MVCSKICDQKYKRNTNIQRSECTKREDLVSHVSYLAELTLPKDDHYFGHMTLRFDLAKKALTEDALKVDFHGLEIRHICINGVEATDETLFDDHGLHLPKSMLLESANTVTIAYMNEYGRNGVGLHSYVDPADGLQYVYTFFEAHYAHEVFPVFDQPNVKASCGLILNAHESWTLISNEQVRETTVYQDKEEWKNALPHPCLAEGEFLPGAISRWEFLTTPKLSSYLYAFCGGAYDFVTGGPSLVCPMKLYYRKSVSQWITKDYADEWFAAADHSTRFFERYMNVAYPYSKMDHIIVPEFNMGAMEQVGCITYTEKYLFKVPPSRSRRVNVTNTIMHEIAHQWFGNLITMHWWDDLWLNEAFATFMSCVAQEAYTDTQGVRTGQEAWLYLVDDAVWGLKEDQEDQTHPIACEANDTVEAENIFDGISYGKGSAFLKTWCHYVGPDRFRQGVRDYFSRYMQSNASLSHFVRAQDEAAPVEVTEWATKWLKTKGAMEVSQQVVERDGMIASFEIKQAFCANADEVFKSHKMDIAFFYKEDVYTAKREGLRKEVYTVDVDASATTIISSLVGKPVPDAVLLNAGYHVYCKAVNSANSNSFLLDNYSRMEDLLDRYTFVVGLISEIKDCRYPALSYLASFEKTLIYERVAFLKEKFVRNTMITIEYVSEDLYDYYVEKLYNVLKADLARTVAEAKHRGVEAKHGVCATTLVQCLITLLSSCSTLLLTEGRRLLTSRCLGEYPLEDEHVRDILSEVVSLKELSNDERTTMIDDILNAMPPSSDRESCRRRCQAAVPTLTNKEAIWKILIDPPKDLSQEAYGDYARAFCTRRHPDLMEPFKDRYFDYVLKIHQEKIHFLAEKFLFNLCPSNVYREDPSYMERLQRLSVNGDKMFKTNVAKISDRDSRRIEARKLTDKNLW